MSIKLRVFFVMSLPALLMILIQFSALTVTYQVSLDLISKYSDDLYLDQQIQMSQLLTAYSLEFNKVFQSFSQNLQIINRFESKILQGEVNLSPVFIKPKLSKEKFYLRTDNPQLQEIALRNSNLASSWTTATIIDEAYLNAASKKNLQLAGTHEFISKAIKLENNNIVNSRNITISIIYEGFVSDGMFSSVNCGTGTTYKTYVPPIGCSYTGPYKFDSRCRQWFLEPIHRTRITPIEPQLFYDTPNSQQLASNLCKRQCYYKNNSDGSGITPSNCGYSVNCITMKLPYIKNFFDIANFKSSKTIMIDPRSQKIVYNSYAPLTNQTTYLSNVTKDIFPRDSRTSDEFLAAIQDQIQRQISDTELIDEEDLNSSESCEFNWQTISESVGLHSVDYKKYSQLVRQINYNDPQFIKAQNHAKSFVFKAIDGEEVFVAVNSIVIIEKLYTTGESGVEDLKMKGLFELQDLFFVINILPKTFLTTWTDKLIKQIQHYLLYFGIAAGCLSVFFLCITGLISYKVCRMIEIPIIHMTDLLNIFSKEGGAIVLDLIEQSDFFEEEDIFLSLDLKILFESLIDIFRTVHLAIQDIFTIDNSYSLIQLNYQINFFKQFKNKRVLGICFNNIGNIHFQNQRYLESMENYQQALIFGYYEKNLYEEKKKQIDGIEEKADRKTPSIERRSVLGKDISLLQALKKKLSFAQKSEVLKIDPTNCSNTLAEDVIQKVIFDRKLNFSMALYMHNIDQEMQENNHYSCQSLKSSKKNTSTLQDWEDYERILLELIEMNESFTDISYGRSVILFSQLSLCYLKMNQFDKSVQFQSQAIDNYEQSLMLEDIRLKNTKGEELILSLSQNTKLFTHHIDMQEEELPVDSYSLTEDRKQSDILEQFSIHRTNSEEKRGTYFVPENLEKQPISISKLLQTRQTQIKNSKVSYFLKNSASALEMNQQQQAAYQSEILQRMSLNCSKSILASNTLAKISQSDNFKDDQVHTENRGLPMKENYTIQETNKRESKDNQKHIANRVVSKSISSTCSKPRLARPSQKLRGNTTHIQKTIQFVSNQTNIDHTAPLPPKKQTKRLQYLHTRAVSHSAQYNQPSQKSQSNIMSPSFTGQDNHKRQTVTSRSIRGKSMINKNLLKEDLEQIQRYELPSDVLLFSVGLQEARILISEKKQWQAAVVLTELLEKTKFYLPFDRLKCLSILQEILVCFSLNVSSLNKMVKRFDSNIGFSVASIIAVSKQYHQAANTCLYLVNEVLTKEENDDYSLMIYSNNSFQQVIPSLSIKQLKATGEFFDLIIQALSEDQLSASMDLSGISSRSQPKNHQSNINSLKNSKENQLDCMQHHFIINKKIELPMGQDSVLNEQSITLNQTNTIGKQLPRKMVELNMKKQFNQVELQQGNIQNDQPREDIGSFSLAETQRFQIDSPDQINSSYGRILSYRAESSQIPSSFSINTQRDPVKITENGFDVAIGSNQLLVSPRSWNNSQLSIIEGKSKRGQLKNSKFFLDKLGVSPIMDLKQQKQSQLACDNNQENTLSNSPSEDNIICSSRSYQNRQNSVFYNCSNSEENQIGFDGNQLSQSSLQKDLQYPVKQQRLTYFSGLSLQSKEQREKKLTTIRQNEEQYPAEDINRAREQNDVEELTPSNNDARQEIETNNLGHLTKQKAQFKLGKTSMESPLLDFLQDSPLAADKQQQRCKLNSVSSSFPSPLKVTPVAQENIHFGSISKDNINLVFHFSLRKSILSYLNKDFEKLSRQKRMTELNLFSKSKKFILFITDIAGITENKAYSMLAELLYATQIQLLVLQLHHDEQMNEKNEISDKIINNKSVIKYFYIQEKLLQYIRNKREPMKNFGVPLLVEHFSV